MGEFEDLLLQRLEIGAEAKQAAGHIVDTGRVTAVRVVDGVYLCDLAVQTPRGNREYILRDARSVSPLLVDTYVSYTIPNGDPRQGVFVQGVVDLLKPRRLSYQLNMQSTNYNSSSQTLWLPYKSGGQTHADHPFIYTTVQKVATLGTYIAPYGSPLLEVFVDSFYLRMGNRAVAALNYRLNVTDSQFFMSFEWTHNDGVTQSVTAPVLNLLQTQASGDAYHVYAPVDLGQKILVNHPDGTIYEYNMQDTGPSIPGSFMIDLSGANYGNVVTIYLEALMGSVDSRTGIGWGSADDAYVGIVMSGGKGFSARIAEIGTNSA